MGNDREESPFDVIYQTSREAADLVPAQGEALRALGNDREESPFDVIYQTSCGAADLVKPN